MEPLHPLSFALHERLMQRNHDLFHSWSTRLPTAHLLKTRAPFSSLPMLASSSLQFQLRERSHDLLTQLQPFLLAKNHAGNLWENAGDADVLSVDYAIVEDGEGGWSLRLVEFQSFTSILTSCFLLHQAYVEEWPELSGHFPWQRIKENANQNQVWLENSRAWMAGEGAILLEQNPETFKTYFDLLAASSVWDAPIVSPEKLLAMCAHENLQHSSPRKILNRLIVHAEESKKDHSSTQLALKTKLEKLPLLWHSHPSWYAAINKGTACELNLKHEPKNVLASEWRSLGLAADQLVAKHIHSYGSQDILLHPTSESLDQLPNPSQWIVQPRYCSYPIFKNSDGENLYGEIRLIIQIKPNGEHWTAMQFARLFHGNSAGANHMRGRVLEGVSLVYNYESELVAH
jgi:hypothetical protein